MIHDRWRRQRAAYPTGRSRISPGVIARLLLALALAAGASSAEAQVVYAANQIPAGNVEIDYRLTIEDPTFHIYTIEIEIQEVDADTVRLAMPAWSPGAYSIRNYARNVQNFQARSGRRPLQWKKIDKQTWEVSKQPDQDLFVTYEVYSTGLAHSMADVSPPALYMYVVGYKHVPVALRYEKPGSWEVHTGLPRRGGAYRAADYDVLIDAPAFVGEFKTLEFESDEVRYRMVFSDPGMEFVEAQVIGDVRAIVEAAVDVFGSAPFDEYVFLFKVRPNAGSGGLEHLNSTRISVGENDFASRTRYERFLFVVSHEFFHLWNVKRIRPEILGPFDYTKEGYTNLLWVSEGLTSYYGRLLLLRAGIYAPVEYINSVTQEINLLQQSPGRFLMSAEEASWNTWVRSDNSENNSISYYTKGELIGLLLDIEIRARTGNEKSLDDVMRYLMTEYAGKGIGFPEDGFREALSTVAGSDFDEVYFQLAQSRTELDYDRYVEQAGLRVRAEFQPSALYMGVQVTEGDGNSAEITRVIADSPAADAGFDAGDIIVAFNERRVTFTNFETEFRRRKLGEEIAVSVLRGQQFLSLELKPGETRTERWVIVEASSPTDEQLELRRLWIGELD